jgi:uncharacterized membrane protein
MTQNAIVNSLPNVVRGARDKQSRTRLHTLTTRFLEGDVDYISIRLSMVIIFAFFGYTKWHLYAVPILTGIAPLNVEIGEAALPALSR